MRQYSTHRALALACVLLAASCSSEGYRVPSLGDAGASADASVGKPGFPVTGIGSDVLMVTGVSPPSGPFSGGTRAVVRGSGFRQGASVRIGDILVQPADVVLEEKGRLSVVMPAGMPGAADVTVTIGEATVTLPGGYRYDALSLEPRTGSTAGGSFVELTVAGDEFSEATTVEVGGAPCTEPRLLTSKRLRCKTPPHALGAVDVVARWPLPDERSLVAEDAFEYVETLDGDRGGLSGGPLSGTLNVSVLDSGGGFVIPGALVLVGDDPNGPHRGFTDARGKITFSGDDLRGPVTVHVAKKCFENGSIVTFDAQNATVFLTPILDLSCIDDIDPSGGGSGGGGGHGQLGSVISGELVFPGSDEFEINAWDIVPEPLAGEVRVAYVFASQTNLEQGNPPPGLGGSLSRVEETTAAQGERGYLYSIFSRPSGLAVYALAGLERRDTGEFLPYVMGVRRNVVTSPGEETKGIDVDMSITLDRELAVSLAGLPAAVSGRPNLYRVQSYVDLGGEGVISRAVAGVSLDTISRYTSTKVFRFIGQPAFYGSLADASYGLIAGFYTDGAELPYTQLVRVGVRQDSDAVSLSGFLGIPQAISPADGAQLPSNRLLRFSLGGAKPDVILVELVGGDGNPAWTLVMPGAAREAPIPDLSGIEGMSDIAAGTIRWRVTAMKLDDFVYDRFEYTDLSPRRLTHDAANAFTTRR